MSQVSSSATTSHDSAARLSLASKTSDSITSALDDAMAQLSAVTQAKGSDEKVAQSHSPELFRLVEAMSSSPSRRDAALQFVDFVEAHCPGRAVRCGVGKGRLRHLLDSRLGWLGPESSLHREFVDRWDPPQRRAEDPEPDSTRIITSDDCIEIHLPQPKGSGRCVLWVEGECGGRCAELIDTIAPILSTIGSVMWSRPSRSLPTIAIKLARHTTVSIIAVAVLLIALAVWPVHYRVACTAKVDTTRQRLVSTPFEATLLKTNVKPGDTVSAGDVLLELDGRPLRLERESIEAEIQQVAKEHDVALATGRIAESQQAALKKRQLTRQHDLLSDRLQRLEVISPIDGVVVSGDLEKYVGSPLERGQSLIEVAPMDKMIIEVEIPEHEIAYVSQGADTRVKLDALGGKSIRLPLTDLFPAAEVRDDRNVFIGRIEVENGEHSLRPGMRGEATTYGPLRPWIWSWVRGGFERVLWWIGY